MTWRLVIAALVIALGVADVSYAQLSMMGIGSADNGPPATPGALMLEDGTSFLLLEDNASHLCLEVGGC